MAPKSKPSHPPPSPPKPTSEIEENSKSESESEQEDETLTLTPNPDHSDSDPDSDHNLSDYRIEPILKPHKATPKRRAAAEPGNSSKPKSKKSKTEETKKKKPVSRRTSFAGCITKLWTNEDEQAVLNGIIDFKNDEGKEPSSDLSGFHGFLNGKLSSEFTKEQLRSKITRLKKRFFNSLKRWGGDDGEDPVFSNPYELKVFDISKRIWGGDGVLTKKETKKESKKEKKKGVEKNVEEEEKGEGEEGDFWMKYPYLNASFRNVAKNYPSLVASEVGLRNVREKISLIGDVKAKELNENWKKLLGEEMEVGNKMVKLMREQVELAFAG